VNDNVIAPEHCVTGRSAASFGLRSLARRQPLGTLRPIEDFLALLVRADSPRRMRLRSYRLFFGLLQGHLPDELEELIEDPEESEDVR
jgi:hypothetical protein